MGVIVRVRRNNEVVGWFFGRSGGPGKKTTAGYIQPSVVKTNSLQTWKLMRGSLLPFFGRLMLSKISFGPILGCTIVPWYNWGEVGWGKTTGRLTCIYWRWYGGNYNRIMTKTVTCCKGLDLPLTCCIRGFCLFLAVPWYSHCNWGEVGFTTGFTVFFWGGGGTLEKKRQEGCNLDTFIEGLMLVQ